MPLLDFWESITTVVVLVGSSVAGVMCDELIGAGDDAGSGTDGGASGPLTTHSSSSSERGLRLGIGLAARGDTLLCRLSSRKLSSRLVLLLLFRFLCLGLRRSLSESLP